MRTALLDSVMLSLRESPIPIDEAIIFGSLVHQFSFDAHSDIDLAVHELGPRDYLSLKVYLEGRLRREVDLVELETCRFQSSIVSGGLRWKRQPT